MIPVLVRLGPTAQRQAEALARHYIDRDRIEAAQSLERAVATALSYLADDCVDPRPHPANYRDLAGGGMSWFKVHVYWFGFARAADGVLTIANVLWDKAEIPSRVQPFDGSQ